MKNLKILSNKLAAPSNTAVALFLLLAGIGFVDATYLTMKHFLGTPVACSLLHGCEKVTTSEYSVIFGIIPLALLGLIYYVIILITTGLYLQTRNRLLFHFACTLTIFGFLTSIYLVYLQIAVIGALCIYCMGSALSSTLLFITAATSLKKESAPNNDQPAF
jgi:uncharacterized membrane protein